MSFLDLRISFNNGVLSFDIFRKPTLAGAISTAAFHSYLKRLVINPLTFGTELNVFLQIASDHNLDTRTVYKILN